jgi:hypothetical protein
MTFEKFSAKANVRKSVGGIILLHATEPERGIGIAYFAYDQGEEMKARVTEIKSIYS